MYIEETMKIITTQLKHKKSLVANVYLNILIFFIGRALQAAYKVVPTIKAEFDALESDFSLRLKIADTGASFLVKKISKKNGKIKLINYGSSNKYLTEKATLTLQLRSIDAAIQIFTFQESTYEGEGNSRFSLDGSFTHAAIFLRILDQLEILLLPKFIAKRAVKRYESPKHKHWLRTKLYIATILGL